MPSIGNPMTILDCVDSSNNYAMQQVHAGMAVHGQAWLAMEQTAGRGQRGKRWVANPGESLALSIALETNRLAVDQQFRLSAAISVAVRQLLGEEVGKGACIKWPNDVYWNDSKAGGTLIENVIRGRTNESQQVVYENLPPLMTGLPPQSQWKWAVVGIGINVNQTHFPDHLPNPVSLKQINGRTYDLPELARRLFEKLEASWQRLASGDWQQIFEEYNNHLYRRGQPVRLRRNNIVMPCTIRGVTEQGALQIFEDKNVNFTFGEVSFDLQAPIE